MEVIEFNSRTERPDGQAGEVVMIQTSNIQPLKIANIRLNLNNPRYDPTASEQEAIATIVRKQGRKLVRLAADIVEKGMNPMKLLMVTPDAQAEVFKVIEGNRRLVALKVLSSPELLNDLDLPPALVKQYKKLQEQAQGALSDTITCAVVPEDEATHWMRLEHTGENEGVGVIAWNTRAKHRFHDSSPALQAIDLVEKGPFLDVEIRSNLENVAVTNIERVLGTPEARKLIGVDLKDRKLILTTKEAVGRLSLLVSDVVKQEIKVKDIMTQEDRVNYAQKLASRPLPQAAAVPPPQSGKQAKTVSTVSEKRTTLVPKGLKLTIPEVRIANIYNELQNLRVDKFVNSCAVLLRVFIEMSVDDFGEHHNISFKQPKVDKEISLRKKLEIVAQFMEKNGLATKKQLHGIKAIVSAKDHVLSIDSWNAYVHNQYYNPSPSDLKNNWDSIQPFVQKVWGA
jgi:uncharacterized protein (DUF1778 family)